MSDSLSLQLLEEHRKRYERIKAWRESQNDPYYTKVCDRWYREFEKERAVAEPPNRHRQMAGYEKQPISG